jgi:hypothetical protein
MEVLPRGVAGGAVSKKRGGDGGNSSRNPRGNLGAQEAYRKKWAKESKSCTGLLHFGGPEVPISHFRQATNNKSTFLQSRCDLCNRLYFSVQQKPIKRAAAAVTFLARTHPPSWKNTVPESLRGPLNEMVAFERGESCEAPNCTLESQHGDYRRTAAFLTDRLSGVERLKRDSWIADERTGERYPAPKILHDLQVWAGRSGQLWDRYPTQEIWGWWVEKFPADQAYCSRELREKRENPDFELVAHSLSDFSWGSGNIKDTLEGHSAPLFNQVKAAASLLSPSGSSAGRAYAFLCEGDHTRMIAISEKFKAQGLSLGHTPAPLRWLGKNDPINAQGEVLAENVRKRDSLAELHEAAIRDPDDAARFVSWQVRPLVVALGKARASREEFTQAIEAEVEAYFDKIADALENGDDAYVLGELETACPGLTQTVYSYRLEKVREWVTGRPSYRASRVS